MTLSEEHRKLKHRRPEIVAKMAAIVRQENDDDKPADEDQAAAFEALVAALADLDARSS